MKISQTEEYVYHLVHGCASMGDECKREYCERHRKLWMTCETVKVVHGGDRDVIGGTFSGLEPGLCPECELGYRLWKAERAMEGPHES